MTSSPSVQCQLEVWLGADCWTPPRLCVISWSITVGCHQSDGSGCVDGLVHMIAVSPPALLSFSGPPRSSSMTWAMPHTGSSVSLSARTNTSRGPDTEPTAAATSWARRLKLLGSSR